MALTAQEQALLDSLTKKAAEPVEEFAYDSLEKIVRYLVHTSDKFSANPDDRTAMLSVLDNLISPSETPAEDNAV